MSFNKPICKLCAWLKPQLPSSRGEQLQGVLGVIMRLIEHDYVSKPNIAILFDFDIRGCLRSAGFSDLFGCWVAPTENKNNLFTKGIGAG